MNSAWSYSPETPNLGQNLRFIVPCDLEIWRVTLKNNRAPLLCYCKLCASFHNHVWIQAGVTVRKRPNWDKICFDLCDLDHWPLTLTYCMDITFVNVKNSWKFHDDMMSETSWKRCNGRTDGRTDGQTEVFLELLGRMLLSFVEKYIRSLLKSWTSWAINETISLNETSVFAGEYVLNVSVSIHAFSRWLCTV